jgi:hypothetical protein
LKIVFFDGWLRQLRWRLLTQFASDFHRFDFPGMPAMSTNGKSKVARTKLLLSAANRVAHRMVDSWFVRGRLADLAADLSRSDRHSRCLLCSGLFVRITTEF